MDLVILKDIPFRIDREALLLAARIKKGSRDEERILNLAAGAEEITRPKAIYREAFIDERKDDIVSIDGILLHGRLLPIKLKNASRVFPFLATCGVEIEEWSQGLTGIRERFWGDTIKMFGLGAALQTLEDHIGKLRHPGKRAMLNPGSLEDWPLGEQRPLFQLLGEGAAAIGVGLTASNVMVPIKSLSGLFFPTEESYENCQLCRREKCPGRRAPFDEDRYREMRTSH
ncbi:MAG: hypothetical protein PHY31_09635 [Smithellaceae bacterium]|nr:hypothetical protein [Smithellaceae bacterium]